MHFSSFNRIQSGYTTAVSNWSHVTCKKQWCSAPFDFIQENQPEEEFSSCPAYVLKILRNSTVIKGLDNTALLQVMID